MKWLCMAALLTAAPALSQTVDHNASQTAAPLPLFGRDAIKAMLGHKVVYHESINHDVIWNFKSFEHLTIEINGQKFAAKLSDAEDGSICTTYLTLNNLVVCHTFILRDNKLTKIDLATQIGAEGKVF